MSLIPSIAGLTPIRLKVWQGCPSARDEGASQLFPPQRPNEEEAQNALLHVVRRDPRQLGVERTRWTLDSLLIQCQDWGWKVSSQAGVCQLLHRLGLHWKRGRAHVQSPDPLYQSKRDFIEGLSKFIGQSAGKQVLLYLDEVTYYRQPSIGSGYEEVGSDRPYAERSYRSDTKTSVVGALDAQTGQLHFGQASKTTVNALVALYQQIATAYPQAERIWVVQDNWPVHFHPDLLVALQKQVCPFPFNPAPNWSNQPSAKAVKQWKHLQLPIQIVPLPTYACFPQPD
jgi:hypothetical protein